MNRPSSAALQPRKTARQARSGVTIDAIHTATIQVLLAEGPGRLTTTRVADRAGVSVGTLYQYYPNKEALLFAMVERQLERITVAMLAAADRLRGEDLASIAKGLASAWFEVKGADVIASRAMYAVAAEFELADLMARAMERVTRAFRDLLASASDRRLKDQASVALTLAAMLSGSVRVVMELDDAEEKLGRLSVELSTACQAYVLAADRVSSTAVVLSEERAAIG